MLQGSGGVRGKKLVVSQSIERGKNKTPNKRRKESYVNDYTPAHADEYAEGMRRLAHDADEEEDRNLAAVPPLTFSRPPINEASSDDLLQRR